MTTAIPARGRGSPGPTTGPNWRAMWERMQSGGRREDSEEFLAREAQEKLLLMPTGGRLLDFGCGSADLLVYYLNVYDAIVGADFSASMLAAARERLARAGATNVTLLQADDRTVWERELGTFRCISADGVVQYFTLAQLDRFVGHAAAALAPGGAICLFGVLDPLLLLLWEGGWFGHDRHPAARAAGIGRAVARLVVRGALRRHRAFGLTCDRHDMAAIAARHGLRAEIVGSIYYPYRYHAVLSRP
jgi:cyclopropane-fatty-acyl-phospholipid synthase